EESLRGGMGTRKQMAGEEDEDDVLCQGAPTASVKNFCGGAWASFCVSGRGAPPRGFRRKEAEEAEEGGGGGGRKERKRMMRMTRSPTGLNRPRPGSDSGHEQITPRVQPLPLQKPLPQKAPA
ncbi:unnamed protein product, partial [Prorocentrum cordatum]